MFVFLFFVLRCLVLFWASHRLTLSHLLSLSVLTIPIFYFSNVISLRFTLSWFCSAHVTVLTLSHALSLSFLAIPIFYSSNLPFLMLRFFVSRCTSLPNLTAPFVHPQSYMSLHTPACSNSFSFCCCFRFLVVFFFFFPLLPFPSATSIF